MTEKEQQIQKIIEDMKLLPVESLRAMLWIIKNIEIVERLFDAKKMSQQEADQYAQMALDQNDHLLVALIHFKHQKDNQETIE